MTEIEQLVREYREETHDVAREQLRSERLPVQPRRGGPAYERLLELGLGMLAGSLVGERRDVLRLLAVLTGHGLHDEGPIDTIDMYLDGLMHSRRAIELDVARATPAR